MFIIANLLLLFLIDSTIGVVVNIKKLGKIEGSVEKSFNGRSYYSFEGIPYAVPPLGVNRFANPKPIPPWSGTRVAKTKYTCLQLSGTDEVNGELPLAGQEDCLYINIYTPSTNKSSNFPVIFFIHGGGFRYGSGTEMGGQFLMDYNVVFVSFNYRLGPLGFLSTGDDIVPGNMAMWDQNLALKFTNKHIKAFGGDSTKITIFGVSSGALSVQFHYLAKPSWGLFQRGFAQSGSVFNSWAIMEEPLVKTKILAAQLNCPTNCTVISMVDCLKSKSGRDIIQQVERLQAWYNPWVPFSIIVDKLAKNPIMEKHPYELMNSGQIYDVPFFTSFTNSEGLDPGSLFYTRDKIQQLNTNWYEWAPILLDYNFTVNPNLHRKVSESIKNKYIGPKKISLETFTDLIPLFGDRLLYNGVKKAFELQNSKTHSPVYLYEYFYRAAHSTSEIWTGSNRDFGASHADDTAMMLQFWVNTTTTPEDRKMQTIMTKLLVGYATTGKPDVGVLWPPISKRSHNSFECMKIRSPSDIRMGTYVFENEEFWDSLPIIENKKLFDN